MGSAVSLTAIPLMLVTAVECFLFVVSLIKGRFFSFCCYDRNVHIQNISSATSHVARTLLNVTVISFFSQMLSTLFHWTASPIITGQYEVIAMPLIHV